jgi:uncharacterized delta-60 repeat protein
MNNRLFHLILTLSFVLCGLTSIYAQPELDISFNATGKVTTDFGTSTDAVSEVLIQPDQRIVAVGTASLGGPTYFALSRYNTNGSLDTSFGDNGKVITDFDANGSAEGAFAAALQPDGKIIAAGYVGLVNPGAGYFAVARYNPDGSLDPTFGAGGKVSTFIVEHMHHIRGVALTPDGKIVVAGDYFSLTQTTQSLIVRYNPDGSLDGSFGSGGKVTDLRWFNPGNANVPWSVAVQPDGKIITGGSFEQPVTVTGADITMVRYNVNGTYDTTFGSGGRLLILSPTVSEVINAIALLPDGRIVAAGESASNFLLMRFNADGSPDVTLDGAGRVTTPVAGSSKANSVIVRPGGKIFVSGLSFTAGQGFAAAYYNADGSLDTSFSGDGMFTMGFDGAFNTAAYCMAIDGGSRIVLGGTAGDKFALARLYTVEPTLVTVTGRTLLQNGQPIKGINMALTNQAGETLYAFTNPFGYFQFQVPTGQTYTLSVSSKRYTFETRVFGVNEAIDNLTLIGTPIQPRPSGDNIMLKKGQKMS